MEGILPSGIGTGYQQFLESAGGTQMGIRISKEDRKVMRERE